MSEKSHLDWQRLDSQYGEDLILFKSRFDQMKNPRNSHVLRRLVLESVDWVNMVALTESGLSVMVRQFRFGVSYATLETPGGMVDPGEDSLTAARRELKEETGYTGGEWTYLGAVEPNPAFHDHLCHHWLARDVVPSHEPEPTLGEAIDVVLMSEAEVARAVQDGVIKHALALSALSRVFELWPRPFVHTQSEQSP